MFIDQPIGVGLSIVVGNESGKIIQINSTVIAMAIVEKFLENFFMLNQISNLKSNPFYIFGESYSGR